MDLGLSLAGFGGLTPRYFATLCARRKAVRRHEDFMLAQIAAAVINFGGRGAKRWFQPSELMPGERVSKRDESAASVNQRVRDIFRSFMGN